MPIINYYWAFKASIPTITVAASGFAAFIADSPAFMDLMTRIANGDISFYEIQQEINEIIVKAQQFADQVNDFVNKSNNASGSSGNSGNFDPNDWHNLLSRAQERIVKTFENTVRDHLKKSDFEAVRNELNGVRYPKTDGTYWNHIHEMRNSYETLEKAVNSLEGSLKNPNLNETVRENLEAIYNQANGYIQEIDAMFSAYGGIYGYK